MILARASSPGCGNSILRSSRPDRISAGSSVSARLVAALALGFDFEPHSRRLGAQLFRFGLTLCLQSQRFGAVGRRDDLDVRRGREAVELVEQLEHRALDLAVARELRVEALGADGVDLVDEDDAGALLFGESERVAHELGAVADKHLDQLRARQLEERRVRLRRAGPRDQRLPRPGRAVEQDALGGLDAEAREALLVRDREHDGLDQLLDLLVESPDVGVVLRGLLVDFHGLDAGVVLGGERVLFWWWCV